jgi:ATP-dependent protease ClpP protease subunit
MKKIQTNFSAEYESPSIPATLTIYDNIGTPSKTSSGYWAKDMAASLSKIPHEQSINLRINSMGGSLPEAVTISNLLKERAGRTRCIIDGICGSAATIIALACDTVTAKKGALLMIHNPSGTRSGDANTMAEGVKTLSGYKDTILDIYESKTKLPREKLSVMMDKVTWMSVGDAKRFGFVDAVENEDVHAFCPVDFNDFGGTPPAEIKNELEKNMNTNDNAVVPPAIKNDGTNTTVVTPEQQPVIEQTVNTQSTPPPIEQKSETEENDTNMIDMDEFAKMRADLDASTRKYNELVEQQTRARVEVVVNQAVNDGKIEPQQHQLWVNKCCADSGMLEMLNNLPGNRFLPPDRSVIEGGKNLGLNDIVAIASNLESEDLYTFIYKHSKELNEGIASNSVTISSDLKQKTILSDLVLHNFFEPLANLLQCFTTVWEDIHLKGVDTVVVPFVPRQNNSVYDYDPATGYQTNNRTVESISIPVDQHKVVGFEFTAKEFSRQPYMLLDDQYVEMMHELKLAIVNYAFSKIVAASYANVVDSTGVDEEDFDRTDIVRARKKCQNLSWPTEDRFLVLNADYEAALLSDIGLGSYLGSGNDGVKTLQSGTLPTISGFKPVFNSIVPTNSEKLVGFVCRKDALAIVGSPTAVLPMNKQVAQCERIKDPNSDLVISIQRWCDPNFRKFKIIFEVEFDAAKLNNKSLVRFISQS